MLCLYIKYMYILYNIKYKNIHIYMNIHVNIFKIYTVSVCIIYIINIHSRHTYICIFDAINRLTALQSNMHR